ncbi:hypothetical protein DFA_09567 [Cavenderia fasciculata]|uniref:Uncharacterized protein n=1 Tax=Cavenderia fasciculata TaxID=261658 RepID=F4Q7Z8_CACFS|nr:uncharacterized protein DFA_09567 [Cavenderia fasciculata]EGG15898.1 hypothetical protein DFA_09567 [Cavenderia fasciculata]|eukprot:XP_004352223.1 hypothetical protein DFA_09567 [Cavenderia fasciculata]
MELNNNFFLIRIAAPMIAAMPTTPPTTDPTIILQLFDFSQSWLPFSMSNGEKSGSRIHDWHGGKPTPINEDNSPLPRDV